MASRIVRANDNILGMSQLGLSKWRTALQKAINGTGTANLVLYGDSITQGYTDGSGSWANESTNATPARLRSLLNQFIGFSAGDGINWLFTTGTYPDTRIINTGATYANTGAFNVTGLTVAGVAQNFKFTPTKAGDTFIIYYQTGPAQGNFTAACASGTQTINSYAANAGIASFTMPVNPSYATDQITITGVASATATILAIEFKATTLAGPGVKVSFCAAQGRVANDLVGGADTPTGSLANAFDMSPPDLSIIHFGANEYASQNTVASFKTAMQTLITRAKASGDVIIVATVPQSASLAIPLSAYTQALYQLAATNNIQVIDLQKRWQSYSNGNTLGLYANGIHPSNNGYADITACYLDAITPFAGKQGQLTGGLKAPIAGATLLSPIISTPAITSPSISGNSTSINMPSNSFSFGSTANSNQLLLYGNAGTGYGLGIDASDTVVFAASTTGISFKDGGYNGTTWMRIRVGGPTGGFLGVGAGNTAPTSVLSVAGAIATAFAAKTGAYTLTATDSIISVDATTAIFTVTLPDATTCVGRQYTIKKIDASVNAVTLACFSTQTIDGATTKAVSGQWTVVKVVSNGANWLVV